MKDTIRFYKIRNLTTGLYSSGGLTPSWNKRGKTWNNIGHIKSHLTGYKAHGKKSIPREWEVVEYAFEKAREHVIPIEEIILASGMF